MPTSLDGFISDSNKAMTILWDVDAILIRGIEKTGGMIVAKGWQMGDVHGVSCQ
jgi:hypothetical protein